LQEPEGRLLFSIGRQVGRAWYLRVKYQYRFGRGRKDIISNRGLSVDRYKINSSRGAERLLDLELQSRVGRSQKKTNSHCKNSYSHQTNLERLQFNPKR
jgi:hypothetical protein